MRRTGLITVEFTIEDSQFENEEHLREYLQTVLEHNLTNEGQTYRHEPIMETLEINNN